MVLKSGMTSRRTFFGTSAALLAGGARSHAATTNRFAELDSRLARHDLKNIHKEDLPTPCMVVDQEIFESNLKRFVSKAFGEQASRALKAASSIRERLARKVGQWRCPPHLWPVQ